MINKIENAASSDEKTVVVIKYNDRRYSSTEKDEEVSLIQEIEKEYNVTLNVLPSKTDDLLIEITGSSSDTISNLKYFVKESLSTQISVYIEMNKVEMDSLYKFLPRGQLKGKGCLDIRKIPKKGNIQLIGGKESVNQTKKMINEYLEWKRNPVILEIKIEEEYIKALLGKKCSEKDKISESVGQFVDIEVCEKNNNIKIRGLSRQVCETCDILTQKFKELKEKKKLCKVSMNRYAYSRIKKNLPFIEKNVENCIFVCHDTDKADILDVSWVGTEKDNILISNHLKFRDSEFITKEVKCSYPIIFTLSSTGIVKKISIEQSCHIDMDFKNEKLIFNALKENLEKAIANITVEIEKFSTYVFETIKSSAEIIKLADNMKILNLNEICKKLPVHIWTEKEILKHFLKDDHEDSFDDSKTYIGIFGKPEIVSKSLKLIQESLDILEKCEKITFPLLLDNSVKFGSENLSIPELIANYCPTSNWEIKVESSGKFVVIQGPSNEIQNIKNAYDEANLDFESNFEEMEFKYVGQNAKIILLKKNIFEDLKEIYGLSKIEIIDDSDKKSKRVCVKFGVRKYKKDDLKQAITEILNDLNHKGKIQVKLPECVIGKYSMIGDWLIRSMINLYNGLIIINPIEKSVKNNIIVIEGPSYIVKEVGKHFDNIMKPSSEIRLQSIFVSPSIANDVEIFTEKCISKHIPENGVYYIINQETIGMTIYLMGYKEFLSPSYSKILDDIHKIEKNTEKIINIPSSCQDCFYSKDHTGLTQIQKFIKKYIDFQIRFETDIQIKKMTKAIFKCHQSDIKNIEKELREFVETWKNKAVDTFYVSNSVILTLIKNGNQLLTQKAAQYQVLIHISQKFFDNLYQKKDILPFNSLITVYGDENNVNLLKMELNSTNYNKKEISCPLPYQEYLWNKKFGHFDKLLNEIGVKIIFGSKKTPPQELIFLEGFSKNVEEANSYIKNIMETIKIKTIEISPKLYGLIIGKGGSNLNSFRHRHNGVEVVLPNKKTDSSTVMVIGNEKNCQSAIDELMNYFFMNLPE